MAETTITGLPNATVPLSGTERVPMDQGGVTRDASAQDIANLAGGAITSAVNAHVGEADPHPGYLLETDPAVTNARTPTAHKSTHATGGSDALSPADIGAEVAGAASSAVSTHVGQADPHTQYALESDLGTAAALDVGTAAGNVVQLDNSAKLPAVDGSLLTGLPTGVTDGDKGDITVSASGAAWTVDNGVITLAKQADVATATVFYRKTAGTGAPEVQSLSTLKTDLGLSGTNTGDQDLTGKASTGAIGSTGITMSTARLLGRSTASTGAVEEITLGTNLAFSGTTLNAEGGGATDLTYDAATREVRSSTGTDATLPLVSSTTPGLQLATGFGTITYASVVTLDFAALNGQANTISLEGALSLTGTNYANGQQLGLRLIAGASDRTLALPVEWRPMGANPPATLPANKVAKLSIECYGSTINDVIYGIAVQP